MVEYWVNVYEIMNRNFIGYKHNSKKECIIHTDRDIVYRLHVKMKDKPGLSREYPYEFGRLQSSYEDEGRWKPYMKLVNDEWIYI